MNYKSYLDPQREGACFKDIWTIYNMLPENTNFTLEFRDYRESGKLLESINFMKCGNPLDHNTVEDYTNHMKEAFRRFGYSGYWSVQMQWNRGFGNSVMLIVVLDQQNNKWR